MKNLVLAFALSLVATGAVASSQISRNSVQPIAVASHATLPVASCPPDDPNACGIVVK